MLNFLLIVVALFLVLLNGFFVAAEFSMVKLRHTRVKAIQEVYGYRGKILSEVHKHLDSYLSACQLGITLASLGLGWIGEPAFAYLLEPVLYFIGITSQDLIEVIAFVVAFSLISFLHIVVGELMPKTLAIRQAEFISIWTAVPLYGFYWLMYPAIWLLNTCSTTLLKWAGLHETHPGENTYSSEEIKLILNSSHMHGELSRDETDIIEHTLDFADLRVTEVMRPKEDMVMLDINMPIDEILQTIRQNHFSRYPVYEGERHYIIGVIHVKDLLVPLHEQKANLDLKTIMRPILKVSHRLPALELLRKFRDGTPHFALVYAGREAPIGFVTLDNLLHVIIGRIKDEFNKTQNDWTPSTDGSILVKGDCSIYSLEQAIDRIIEIEEDEKNIVTLTGLIFHRLETLPNEGDRIEFDEFSAIIEKQQRGKIQFVRVLPKAVAVEE